jgi:geranylgeranyl diphosphate synthase type I
LCEGEYLDITFQESLSVKVEDYLRMAEARTGALLGCAAQLGALAVQSGSAPSGGRLNEFGSKLGAARQVAGDIAALWNEGPRDAATHGRLIVKKKNLAVVHAISNGDPKTRRKLGDLYVQRTLEPSAIQTVTGILESAGSRRFAEDTLARLLAEADAALLQAELNQEGTQLLRAAAKEIVKTGV